jgi:hypothetical protein
MFHEMGGRAPILLLWWAFSLSGRATLPGSSSQSKLRLAGIQSLVWLLGTKLHQPQHDALSDSLLIHLGKGDGQIEVGVRHE